MSGTAKGRPLRSSEAHLGQRDLRGRREIRAARAQQATPALRELKGTRVRLVLPERLGRRAKPGRRGLKGIRVRLARPERLGRRAKPGSRGLKGSPDRGVQGETKDPRTQPAIPAPPDLKAIRARLVRQGSLGRRAKPGRKGL